MTNHELQEKVLAYIQGLGITLDRFRKADRSVNPYPISNRAVADIARGKFESREVGKFGIMKMKDYYLQLKTKNDDDDSLCKCEGMRDYMRKPKGRFCLKCGHYIWLDPKHNT